MISVSARSIATDTDMLEAIHYTNLMTFLLTDGCAFCAALFGREETGPNVDLLCHGCPVCLSGMFCAHEVYLAWWRRLPSTDYGLLLLI